MNEDKQCLGNNERFSGKKPPKCYVNINFSQFDVKGGPVPESYNPRILLSQSAIVGMYDFVFSPSPDSGKMKTSLSNFKVWLIFTTFSFIFEPQPENAKVYRSHTGTACFGEAETVIPCFLWYRKSCFQLFWYQQNTKISTERFYARMNGILTDIFLKEWIRFEIFWEKNL